MIWNVFFVVFVVLVLAAIGLTVWFLKLGKRIFLLIPLLLLAGSVAYFAVYYTADNNFPPAQVMVASNFPSTVDSALVEESLQKADGNYTRTDEYDTGTVQYTLRLTSEEQQNATAFFDAKPTIRGGEYTRSDIKTSLAMKYTAMGRMDAFSTVPQKYWPLITPSTPLTAAATAKAAAMCP
jgi:hypothetical protein